MTILQHSIAQAAAAATGYQISRSLRFNSADSAYLNRTPASAGNRQKWTWSGWVKRSTLGVNAPLFCAQAGESNGSLATYFGFSDEKLYLFTDTLNTANIFTFASVAVFRDVSAWYHIVVAYDSAQAVVGDRIKLYVNGAQQTFNHIAGTLSQNYETQINATVSHATGRWKHPAYSADFVNGYITEVRFIDGQALTHSSFGETDSATGVWVPKAYTGTYGTNGFWLKFDDNSGVTATTLGKDSSGNGNNWTPNNFSVTAGTGNDSLVDSPTNYGTDTGAGGEVRGNYCTLNPLDAETPSSLSNGNLDQSGGNNVRATMGALGSGKFYWEFTKTSNRDTSGNAVGHAGIMAGAPQAISALTTHQWYRDDGTIYENNSLAVSGLATWTNGDVIGIALNCDTSQISWYKNGTLISTRSFPSGLTAANAFAAIRNNSGQSGSLNFGQRPFAYTAPSGFKALCTQNLPTPAIGASASTLAEKNFSAVLYTGDAASSRSITGVGFQPDFVWIKPRSQAYSHGLFDAVRGGSRFLISNATNAELVNDAQGSLSAFNSDGFTITAGATNNLNFNGSGVTHVAWNWKANGAGSTNNAGSIQSTVSANTTAGISVVTYTGTGTAGTIGHGLGVAPKMMILKSRSDAGSSWIVYHSAISPSNLLTLQNTGAQQALPAYFNSTAPTSNVFSIGSAASTGVDLNVNTKNYVAYCFAEVAGFSRFGSYTGNGSADGVFVYCGFRPRFVFVKSTAIENWIIHDTARDTFNETNKELIPNSSGAENTTTPFDILSNGFKMRANNAALNSNNQTYIFAAFAEAPFNYARAR